MFFSHFISAIGRTQGRPFIEELRSGADATNWSVTGIPDQKRVKKIQRVRRLRKFFLSSREQAPAIFFSQLLQLALAIQSIKQSINQVHHLAQNRVCLQHFN